MDSVRFYSLFSEPDDPGVKKTQLCTAFISVLASTQVLAEAVDADVLWQFCPAGLEAPARPIPEQTLETGATSIAADDAELVETGISSLSGNVELIRDEQTLKAQQVDYDNEKDTATASTDVEYWGTAMYWAGQRTHVDLGKKTATFEQGDYQLLARRGHGEADRIHDDQLNKTTTLDHFSYSTCQPQSPDWQLKGKHVELNHEKEIGTARHVSLYVKDVPVFYFPYVSFPLSDKRKSGFLPPSFGSSSDSGFDLTVPYYWNIAPWQDATLAPRHINDRGTMLTGEYRWLLERGHGQINGEWLGDDEVRNRDNRYLFNFDVEHKLGKNGMLTLDYNKVSDKEYFEDLGNSLSVSSTRFLTQRAIYTNHGNHWNVYAMLDNYQNVDPSLPATATPYKRLPYLSMNLYPFAGGNYRLNSNLYAQTVYFDRDDGVVGGRIQLQPSISFPMRSSGSFIVPRLDLNHTEYLLDQVEAGQDDHLSRTIPTFSIDSGLFLERQMQLGGRGFLHTLEPRVYYLYVPHEGQDDIPIFDSGEYGITFAQLFRPNRFSGNDRIGDANQISFAVTTRLLDQDNGQERLRASIGQIYHFRDRQVSVTPGAPQNEDGSSEIIAELAARFSDHWTSAATMQWNPNNNRTDKSAFHIRYRKDDRRLLNLSYRFNSQNVDIEQADLSARWPLSQNWSAIARWNYSVPDSATLETVAGLEYNSCCWGIRAVARRHLSTVGGLYDNSIFVQFVLKGLAGFGQSTTSFLKQSVPGYSPEF